MIKTKFITVAILWGQEEIMNEETKELLRY